MFAFIYFLFNTIMTLNCILGGGGGGNFLAQIDV